jgi:hypothetical protein
LKEPPVTANNFVNKKTTFSCEELSLKQNFKCRPSCFGVGELLRPKLNRAGKATDVKLAASKTALGLHSVSNFPNSRPIDN